MFNHADLEKKYNEAPQEIKNLLASQETIDKISNIGKKYTLQIDRVGKIEEIITLFSLSLVSEKEFLNSIYEVVDGNKQKANSLVDEINQTIFLPIRKKIMSETSEINNYQKITQKSQNESNRNDILSEIENPSPVEHPISIAQEKTEIKTKPTSGDEVAHDFIGEKLSTPVSLPSQKTVIQPEVKKSTPTVDPYREPIN
ncbi:MAG: hypothetical protein COV01_00650 [Candidatus Taylorbacteria bacterium CG10_big_fil_rev_8_21_14_0_10_41_48]|uniref:Uncharacterized protein n=1 Tax=Candidatus Taylorbacteria bacterium CG10_big_fil_rev_8_21_14_0_10_41_48 TaxID=1975024 RepID=A0A2M8LD23_9BACT|nr:MAG: hypothetical protein COV01_00650 [Candidatus Taylorbacteria bacterium CG10_big_fil_rev_8_21_14_0_10_41_48]